MKASFAPRLFGIVGLALMASSCSVSPGIWKMDPGLVRDLESQSPAIRNPALDRLRLLVSKNPSFLNSSGFEALLRRRGALRDEVTRWIPHFDEHNHRALALWSTLCSTNTNASDRRNALVELAQLNEPELRSLVVRHQIQAIIRASTIQISVAPDTSNIALTARLANDGSSPFFLIPQRMGWRAIEFPIDANQTLAEEILSGENTVGAPLRLPTRETFVSDCVNCHVLLPGETIDFEFGQLPIGSPGLESSLIAVHSWLSPEAILLGYVLSENGSIAFDEVKSRGAAFTWYKVRRDH